MDTTECEPKTSGAGEALPPRYNFSNTPVLKPMLPSSPSPLPPTAAPRIQSGPRLLLVALAVSGAADALLYGQSLGVGFPIFVLALVGGLAALGFREGTPVRWRNAAPLSALLLFFAAMTAVRASSFLTFCNIVACAGLLPLLAHFYAAGDLRQMGFGALLGTPGRVFGNLLFRAVPVVQEASARSGKNRDTAEKAAPLLRGVLLALPILSVFVYLLSSADAVFSQTLESVGGWLDAESLAERGQRGLLILGAAWLIAGGFVYAITRRDPEPAAEPRLFTPPLGFIEGMVVLTSVLGVFVAFIAIQFAYLFGGSERVLAVPGLTYAEYARRGFAELVIVAVLALALILGLRTLTRRETAGKSNGFIAAAIGLIGMTQILLVSAFQRMSAYEAAYGVTELRLYVDVFIVWLGIALFWFAGQLWQKSTSSFAPVTFACACGFLFTLNVVSPDAFIAHRNLVRYQTTGKLDDGYILYSLSDDAVPELCASLRITTGHDRQIIAARLRDSLTRLEAERTRTDWPSTHFAQREAFRCLKNAEKDLPTQAKAEAILRTHFIDDACRS